ncbi:DUF2306 domain-containing protein [Bacillus sp. PSXD-155]|uniref:DUF2306 domain-containing protein n=1 Tax=Bacillus sp. PSXD-155 TaxID=3404821 RepID=UPI003BB6BED0
MAAYMFCLLFKFHSGSLCLFLCNRWVSEYNWVSKQKVILHSQWMIRSFFLSFANMTIYIIVAITHKVLNFPYGTSYTIAVWLCWILNLLIAELIIRKKTSYKKSYDANL